ncbi:hypothetical protein N784_09825 [Pontibacillus litoralis JSM 072002]|uniref:Uncharacterized protein n=1 Tax=Pontibacillus litoralis JSM 072002 TaxID=1385512 RepID=A0A0A5G279_9BACI|nr:hypothetical protein N784_09825 [Pontibacillus litoralis JSM 072002]
MIEQNTDRIYWAIGWIVVLGVVIGLIHVSFPEIFGIVTDNFQNRVPKF